MFLYLMIKTLCSYRLSSLCFVELCDNVILFGDNLRACVFRRMTSEVVRFFNAIISFDQNKDDCDSIQCFKEEAKCERK